ncbi:LysR family transcriptional regulator [Listeria valentina]|uniref:LysR family transcriptional regulator n=1 Tax=Listeria valentina TaxID=2705293 RepID=UPI0014317A40|nr:LysR family transcriptional regulator [Listeria valentina]
MDFNQLHYFIITAETEHLTLAAEKLALSQSALSRSIQNLEKELGLPLFDRDGRGIQLNQFGKQFYQDALKLMDSFTNSKKELAMLADPDFGLIRLGFTHTLGFSLVPKLLKAFRVSHPNNHFEFHESRTDELLERVQSGELDIGLAVTQPKDPAFSSFPVTTEKMAILLSKDHPLASKKQFDLENLTNETFFHFNRETPTREIIDQFLLKRGLVPRFSIDGLEIASILGLVEANLGIAIVPESVAPSLAGIRTYPLELKRTIYAIYRTQGFLARAPKAFLEFLQETKIKTDL